jgi:hypothetical protein
MFIDKISLASGNELLDLIILDYSAILVSLFFANEKSQKRNYYDNP